MFEKVDPFDDVGQRMPLEDVVADGFNLLGDYLLIFLAFEIQRFACESGQSWSTLLSDMLEFCARMKHLNNSIPS